jgi:hypothetical protein
MALSRQYMLKQAVFMPRQDDMLVDFRSTKAKPYCIIHGTPTQLDEFKPFFEK